MYIRNGILKSNFISFDNQYNKLILIIEGDWYLMQDIKNINRNCMSKKVQLIKLTYYFATL